MCRGVRGATTVKENSVEAILAATRELLYTMVGGAGQGIVAFDKRTGDVRWKALDARGVP